MTEARGGVLVSDFDGTMTRRDFFKVAAEHLAPADLPDYWAAYREGRVSHFEALRGIYASIRKSEAEVIDALRHMQLDPALPQAVGELRAAGWDVVVASAGCGWYIDRLLSGAGVALEVHASPGRFEEGQGLLMSLPAGSPYLCHELGIDKAAVVRAALKTTRRVAFAGDGYPDLAAARLVEPGLRFAKADLARALRGEGLTFLPFDRWADVARALLRGA